MLLIKNYHAFQAFSVLARNSYLNSTKNACQIFLKIVNLTSDNLGKIHSITTDIYSLEQAKSDCLS